MKRWVACLLLSALGVVALPVLAAPPDCDIRCRCSSPCGAFCSLDGGPIITCGEAGICQGMCFAPVEQAAVSELDGTAPATPACSAEEEATSVPGAAPAPAGSLTATADSP